MVDMKIFAMYIMDIQHKLAFVAVSYVQTSKLDVPEDTSMKSRSD